MSNRSRSRSRSRGERGSRLRSAPFLFAIAAVVALPLAVGTVAYTSATLPRGGAMDVVAESNGALDLDTVSDVNVGNRERLVTIVNRLNRGTTVTVSITSGPGTLYTSSGSGSSVSFSLSQGASNTVDIEAGGTGGDTITYQIEATGGPVTATATRSVQTLSTGQAAPGYPSAFNDNQGGLEANENASIPPGNNAQGDLKNFANMQQANDGNSFASLDGSSLNIGIVHRNPPDNLDEYELQIRYKTETWTDGAPTVNIVDASGNVFQSTDLTDTNTAWNIVTVSLTDAAENFVRTNDDFYVTYTKSTTERFDVDFQRIQKDPPPPVADFSVNCNVRNCTFDASASTGYSHPITEYAWKFGDGSTVTTSASVTNHTYASNGSFNVKLTVTTSTDETNSTSQLLTVGSPSPTYVPPDVFDDIEYWSGEPPKQYEDNSIPPSSPDQELQNFPNMLSINGSTATLQGGPMNLGVATRGISGSGSAYELFVRYTVGTDVDVFIVDANNNVLQSATLSATGGSLTNETIALNSNAESYVKNTGNLYVRYAGQGSGWVSLKIDAQLLKIEP